MKYQSDFTPPPPRAWRRYPFRADSSHVGHYREGPPGCCGEFFGRHFRCSLSIQFGKAVCANITSTLLDFFYAICRCQSLYAPVIYMSKHSFFKKKVLKSLCEIITYEMELSYGTSIFRRETKFDKHDRFWTRNVSCPKLRNVKVTNEFHWQLDYNPRVVKLFGM